MFKMLVHTFYALLLASKESFTGSGASGHWCLRVCVINCAVPAARLFSSSAEVAAPWSSLTTSPGSSPRLCASQEELCEGDGYGASTLAALLLWQGDVIGAHVQYMVLIQLLACLRFFFYLSLQLRAHHWRFAPYQGFLEAITHTRKMVMVFTRRVFIPPQTVVEGGFAIDTLCYCEAVIPLRSETSCLGCWGKDRTATALQTALEDQLKPSWESASRSPSSYGCYRGREVLWPSLSHSSLETQQWRLDSPWDLGESVLFFRSFVLFLS